MSEENEKRNPELNEAALEQASGGAETDGSFNKIKWFQRNCDSCAKRRACHPKVIQAALRMAEKKAKKGEEWNCHEKC